ncbi:hypothetical protein NCAS_0C01420 [Naumovozyma castellii]|uniref:Tyrosine specific protein phosphatases domain-containing protein n=1 Tax=Naumovozyma castellii TaxID=27288 RepID=G0VCC3_NAUCA|nr:hypothetical protein NCAS_0C01420 [Naumovozyma castellii CBS 4309]CCC69132.1 hypothetical protein NCAS_0C01420 [Naumovozyma castellii CBS 4309]
MDTYVNNKKVPKSVTTPKEQISNFSNMNQSETSTASSAAMKPSNVLYRGNQHSDDIDLNSDEGNGALGMKAISVQQALTMYKNQTHNHYLIFDLSCNEMKFPNISSNFKPISERIAHSSLLEAENVDSVHLTFPSTLLRRQTFDFERLLETIFSMDKKLEILKLIEECNVFIFFDDISTMSSCSKATYTIILKFKTFLEQTFGETPKRLYLLSEQHPSLNKKSNHLKRDAPNNKFNISGFNSMAVLRNPRANTKNLGLQIKIPTTNTRTFAQSLKKDSVNYSPNSLKKYFSFTIPKSLDSHDNSLPSWLKRFSEKGKDQFILEKLSKNFNLLEELEVNRLSSGLDHKKPDINNKTQDTGESQFPTHNQITIPSDVQASSSYHKIYSLSHLQKQFKKQKRKLSQPVIQKDSSQISIDDLKNIVSKNNNIKTKEALDHPPTLTPLIITTGDENQSNPHMLSPSQSTSSSTSLVCPFGESYNNSSEILLTPLDNYELSQGIQSFAKNRYSNILPYEHTRVKLEPSPVNTINDSQTSLSTLSWKESNDNDSSVSIQKPNAIHKDKNILLNSLNNSPNDTERTFTSNNDWMSDANLARKRRNSYFGKDSPVDPFSSLTSSNFVTSDFSTSLLLSPRSSSNSEKSHSNHESNTKNPLQFDDYFNANYLKLPQINPDYEYVATQAPLPSTMDDFWKVVISNCIKVIVSLNSDDELALKKWDVYWNSNSCQNYKIKVVETFTNFFNLDGLILRVFEVTKCKGHEKISSMVFQLQYTKWIDSCSICMPDLLKLLKIKDILLVEDPKDFIEEWKKNKVDEDILNRIKGNSKKVTKYDTPLLVHCSAGCGRTGVFITLDFLINVLTVSKNASNRIDVWNMKQDLIFIIVNELRKQRLSMVQNLTQYITCYESILEYFALLKDNEN